MVQAVPSWVVPSKQQLDDCERLASSVHRAIGQDCVEAGVVAVLRWVVHAEPAPLTRTEQAATVSFAEQEFHVAGEVELGRSPLSATVPRSAAQGVRLALAWLLGRQARPPIELPRRPLPTAEQCYNEAVAAEPARYRLPEEQAAGHLAAQREANRLARLAARADGV